MLPSTTRSRTCLAAVVMAIGVLTTGIAPTWAEESAPEPDVEIGPSITITADDEAPIDVPADGFLGGDGKGNQDEECWTWDESELGFLERINEARRRHGLRAVDLDPELSKVAQHHSYHMKTEQRLYHTPAEKLRERVTNWELLGENVGRGSEVDSLHRSFMESDDHRQVVLNEEFRFVGIGVSHDEDQMWVTILLEARENPGTTMEMDPSC